MSDESQCVAAFEPCGCCRSVQILSGEKHDAEAYREAGEAAGAGCEIVIGTVGAWRARVADGMICAAHKPYGPDYWESNRGRQSEPTLWGTP